MENKNKLKFSKGQIFLSAKNRRMLTGAMTTDTLKHAEYEENAKISVNCQIINALYIKLILLYMCVHV